MEEWLTSNLALMSLNPNHLLYLRRRGVTQLPYPIDFKTWSIDSITLDAPCERFRSAFGNRGEKLNDQFIIPIKCPRGRLIGFEARSFKEDGTKIVRKYNLDRGEWNPYLLGSEDVFRALWEGDNIWIVEGVFDLVALKRVIPAPTAVGSTMRAGMDNLTLEFIKRYYIPTTSIFVCYDNDETGRNKAGLLVNQLKKLGVNAYDWKYRGKDPNEVWQQGGDSALMKNFLY